MRFGISLSYGDLQNVDIIENRSVQSRLLSRMYPMSRGRSGLPSRYQKGRFLGKGGFAKCYEVQDLETKEAFAAAASASLTQNEQLRPRSSPRPPWQSLEPMPSSGAALQSLREPAKRSEIAIHKELQHEKVVKFYEHFEEILLR